MDARDLLGDFREGRVARPGIIEAVLRHRDGVRAAMPFAHQPSTRLQSKARIWTYPAGDPKHLRQRLELAAGRLAEPTMLKLLAAIGDPAQKKIATDSGRLVAVKPPPARTMSRLALARPPVESCKNSFGAELESSSRSSATMSGLLITNLLRGPKSGSCTATSPEPKPGTLGVLRGPSVCATRHASFASEVQRKVGAVIQNSSAAVEWPCRFSSSNPDCTPIPSCLPSLLTSRGT
jgi:hypothetical protein